MFDLPNVRPGQTWADNDKRAAGRKVHDDSIDAITRTARSLPIGITPSQGTGATTPPGHQAGRRSG